VRPTARLPLFEKDGELDAFERVVEYAQQRRPTRLLSICMMPNRRHV
jgi:hypothetical protein